MLIRVAATSVNRPDIVQRQGNYAPPPGESEILGLEAAGEIEAVGTGVKRWRVGDRVFALLGGGGYAEAAVAWAGHCLAVPDGMTFEQAACIAETYLTAYLNLFMLAGLENGQAALIHGGGGGVNTAAVQLCRELAPDSPLFVTASPGKLDRVRALGATQAIDYRSESFPEVIAEHTDKHGVKVILDHIGGPYLQDNLRALSIGGTLVLIGVSGGAEGELNLARLMVKRQRILGSVLRPRPMEEKDRIIHQFASVVMPLFEAERMMPLVHAVLPLKEAAEAHRMMEASKHFGKIVLTP